MEVNNSLELFCLLLSQLTCQSESNNQESAGRFLGQLVYGLIKGNALESQGQGLMVLLIFQEETRSNREDFGWEPILNVHHPFSLLTCDFVLHLYCKVYYS